LSIKKPIWKKLYSQLIFIDFVFPYHSLVHILH
jgi:hypothetical protein